MRRGDSGVDCLAWRVLVVVFYVSLLVMAVVEIMNE
jgi:hypothetical protein